MRLPPTLPCYYCEVDQSDFVIQHRAQHV
jgi:hypothetical protein